MILSDPDQYMQGRYVPLESDEHLDAAVYAELADGVARRPERHIRMVEPVVDLSPAFASLARRAEVTAPARAILGDDVLLFEDTLNYKPPGGAGFVWHQDWACCWRAHTDELVTCFVYLDDSA
jgi:Phytanoyl-CoA dioxygenase (PhyH)